MATMAHPDHTWLLRSGQVKDSHKWAGSERAGKWNLQRVQKKDVPGGPLLNYQQHLHRLLGSERASYFLHPPTMERPVSPQVKRLLIAGIDMGAEEVWRALHEEPKYQREVAAAKMGHTLSQQVPWLGCPATTHRLQQVALWRQQLYAMHHLGKQHQCTASHLLATKNLPDFSDTYGTGGPTRYFHGTLDKEQMPLRLVSLTKDS
ncbi:coiled-coil domain-containing protein 71 isoform X2 [Elgaria multicarinata webbii]|uniref:coiled-coil domain-containing protein 71 isoform X2 n=1 Tax=Elgaria multicarinata webbii TaxID=159646 RepID=UPI002FCCF27C